MDHETRNRITPGTDLPWHWWVSNASVTPFMHFIPLRVYQGELRNIIARTVARKFSIGGFAFVRWGGLTFQKLTKTQLIYSVSCLNLGGLGALFGGTWPSKALPRGDGTDYSSFQQFGPGIYQKGRVQHFRCKSIQINATCVSSQNFGASNKKVVWKHKKSHHRIRPC